MPPGAAFPRWIYHLALRDEWQRAANEGGLYRRSTLGTSLDDEGYIHCSFAEQVQAIADRVYRGRCDVVLLRIDPGRLQADLRVEAVEDPGAGDQRFPHIYGPLPVEAVVRAVPVPLGADGRLLVDHVLEQG